MAEVSIEKRPSSERRGLAPRGYDPFGFRSGPLLAPWRMFEPFFASPLSAMVRRMEEEIDRWFASGGAETQGWEAAQWWPSIDVSEREGKMIVRADLPGISTNDVKVELTDGNLTIRGERRREREEEKEGIRRSERSYGHFFRSIPLPESINADQVRAQFKDGVLEVTIPVPESHRAKTIPIEQGSEKKQIASEAAAGQQQRKAS